MPHNPLLFDILSDHIRQAPDQRISFADFMELVLYHPQAGYYTTKEMVFGPKGDFITSPHLVQDFGELLAEQFVELWHSLGTPKPFTLVEMGAGQGILAADVLAYLAQQYPQCFASLSYAIVEKSGVLRATQQHRLAPWLEKVTWVTLDSIPDVSITGCFFSNELVDAFPVHQVILMETGLQEVFVTLGDDGKSLREVVAPRSTSRLEDYFDLVGIDFSDSQYAIGYRTEVHLAALDWMQMVATKLSQGYVVTIDYGYPASRYYNRARSQGTLQCYYHHAYHNDPYSNLGYQDITAHVNFTALERQGERSGLTTLGITQQAMFLMALGLGDRLAALADIQSSDPVTVQKAIVRRDQLHQLMNPMGLGNFVVLVQGKQLPQKPTPLSLRGLHIPPLV